MLQKYFSLTDRALIYNSEYLDPDGERVILQNKVLFDFLYYFCQRGGENLEIVQQDWFELKYDSKIEHEYVTSQR